MPRLPRETKADVAKCHACHAKVPRRHGAQARHQSQPSPVSATLATWNEDRCRQGPRLPRETEADVAKCHACHAKVPRRHSAQARHQSQPSPISATLATWNEDRCRQGPRLPVKRRQMSPIATPATWQSCMWQSCVCDKVVCDKVVCEKVVCMTICMWQSCVWQEGCVCVCVWKKCVWQTCVW